MDLDRGLVLGRLNDCPLLLRDSPSERSFDPVGVATKHAVQELCSYLLGSCAECNETCWVDEGVSVSVVKDELYFASEPELDVLAASGSTNCGIDGIDDI